MGGQIKHLKRKKEKFSKPIEDHITIIIESDSAFLGYVTPKSYFSKETEKTIIDYLLLKNIYMSIC